MQVNRTVLGKEDILRGLRRSHIYGRNELFFRSQVPPFRKGGWPSTPMQVSFAVELAESPNFNQSRATVSDLLKAERSSRPLAGNLVDLLEQ